jgi:hypothetical protein
LQFCRTIERFGTGNWVRERKGREKQIREGDDFTSAVEGGAWRGIRSFTVPAISAISAHGT